MGSIRRSDASRQARDVEAQASKDVASATFPTPPGASHNPLFLAKMILRKVATLLLSDGGETDLTHPGGVVALLKDIIIGVLCGVVTISFVIFLDYRDVIHFQSAHKFRNVAFNSLNDPETIAALEESLDIKFMTARQHEAWRRDVEHAPKKMARMEEQLEKRRQEAGELNRQFPLVKEEYAKLTRAAELDKYCGSCQWANNSCDKRVEFLQNTYKMSKIGSQIGLMKDGHCKEEG